MRERLLDIQQPELPPQRSGASLCEQSVDSNKEKLQWEESNRKAMKLLQDTIGNEQFINLVANGSFSVTGKHGVWEIPAQGLLRLKTECVIGTKVRPLTWGLCVNVKKDMPEGDRLLALYLSITGDEDNLIKTANFRNVSTETERELEREVVNYPIQSEGAVRG